MCPRSSASSPAPTAKWYERADTCPGTSTSCPDSTDDRGGLEDVGRTRRTGFEGQLEGHRARMATPGGQVVIGHGRLVKLSVRSSGHDGRPRRLEWRLSKKATVIATAIGRES